MIDPLNLVNAAIDSDGPQTALLMFGAGAATSAGPCVAARYVLLSALTNASARRERTTGAFIGGLVAAYVALASGAGALTRFSAGTGALNLALALLLSCAGVYAIVAGAAHSAHVEDRCRRKSYGRACDSVGAAFVLGAASSITISPCCAPVIAAVIAVAASAGRALHAAWLLGWFAAGHALILVCCGGFTSVFARRIASFCGPQAPAMVGGTLMLALGAYNAVLA
ncbi:MAG: cytochrome c biogenesis protein CcdA [Candidatus Velthaea sp.]